MSSNSERGCLVCVCRDRDVFVYLLVSVVVCGCFVLFVLLEKLVRKCVGVST